MPLAFEFKSHSLTIKGTRAGLEGLIAQARDAMDNGSSYSAEPLGTPSDGDVTMVLMPDHWKPK